MHEFLQSIFDRLTAALHTPAPFEVGRSHGTRRFVAVRDDFKIEELAGALPPRPSRRHTVTDVESFAAFVATRFDVSTTEVLAAPNGIVAFSAVEWDHDTIACALPFHPTFAAWSKLLSTPMGQKQVYQLLAGMKSTIVAGDPLPALRQLEIGKAGTYKLNLTAGGAVEFISTESKMDIRGTLPTAFVAACPAYYGGPDVRLDVEIIVDNLDSTPTFTLRVADIESIRLGAFEERVAALRELLPGYLIGLGTGKIGA